MDDDIRIPTEIWLMAQLRRIEGQGGFYYVQQRGSDLSGTILIKIRQGRHIKIFQQNRDFNGVLGWIPLRPKGSDTWVVEESWADAYIQRAIDRDPDLWVVEIETMNDDFPLEGPVFYDLG